MVLGRLLDERQRERKRDVDQAKWSSARKVTLFVRELKRKTNTYVPIWRPQRDELFPFSSSFVEAKVISVQVPETYLETQSFNVKTMAKKKKTIKQEI